MSVLISEPISVKNIYLEYSLIISYPLKILNLLAIGLGVI